MNGIRGLQRKFDGEGRLDDLHQSSRSASAPTRLWLTALQSCENAGIKMAASATTAGNPSMEKLGTVKRALSLSPVCQPKLVGLLAEILPLSSSTLCPRHCVRPHSVGPLKTVDVPY